MIQPETENGSERDRGSLLNKQQAAESKKNNRIILIALSVIIALIILYAILIGVAIKNRNNDNPSTPGTKEFNPYTVDAESQQFGDYSWTGKFNMQPKKLSFATFEQEVLVEGDAPTDVIYYKPVNPTSIPNALNNQFAEHIQYTFGLCGSNCISFHLQDTDRTNQFKVSDSVFKEPVYEDKQLKDLNLTISSKDSFSFGLKNADEKDIFSTTNRKLLISEKFSEVGFTLPTRRLFGLGQHNS
jgi:hypothetical protein